jgi:hypothetical protein
MISIVVVQEVALVAVPVTLFKSPIGNDLGGRQDGSAKYVCRACCASWQLAAVPVPYLTYSTYAEPKIPPLNAPSSVAGPAPTAIVKPLPTIRPNA